MKWTRDLPKKSGWYWFKDDRPIDSVTEECVRIEIHPRFGPLFRSGRSPYTAKDWPGWWSDRPIRKPSSTKVPETGEPCRPTDVKRSLNSRSPRNAS
jgi:hypothetical protein